MAPVVPLIPSILAFTGTIIQAATQDTPKVPDPRRLDDAAVDNELRDAQKRKGRQIFTGEQSLLAGGKIGADRLLGTDQLLIGSS